MKIILFTLFFAESLHHGPLLYVQQPYVRGFRQRGTEHRRRKDIHNNSYAYRM